MRRLISFSFSSSIFFFFFSFSGTSSYCLLLLFGLVILQLHRDPQSLAMSGAFLPDEPRRSIDSNLNRAFTAAIVANSQTATVKVATAAAPQHLQGAACSSHVAIDPAEATTPNGGNGFALQNGISRSGQAIPSHS